MGTSQTCMNLYISRFHYPVTTLGFGRRVGIWFQGCSIRCPGCISRDTWEFAKGQTSIGAVVESVAPWLKDADGLTISGGEPFDQPEALIALLDNLKPFTTGDILVYSGYSWEKIRALLPQCPQIDVLISDPFIESAPHTRKLRGSDNQTMHLLTELAEVRYGQLRDATRDESDKALDLFFDSKGDAWMVGIPSRNALREIGATLKVAGFTCSTSEDSNA
jgi:anaerobic ribonucleoside-triphosphate reductase activating protein